MIYSNSSRAVFRVLWSLCYLLNNIEVVGYVAEIKLNMLYDLFLQVNYLGLIGGLTIKTTAFNILKALLMNNLARQFNFCGQRGKHSFKSLLLKEVLHG